MRLSGRADHQTPIAVTLCLRPPSSHDPLQPLVRAPIEVEPEAIKKPIKSETKQSESRPSNQSQYSPESESWYPIPPNAIRRTLSRLPCAFALGTMKSANAVAVISSCSSCGLRLQSCGSLALTSAISGVRIPDHLSPLPLTLRPPSTSHPLHRLVSGSHGLTAV